MKNKGWKRPARPARSVRGFALVIVLFLLGLILILVIAFAANMRTERKAAHNVAQGQRADLLAESALAHAVSLLANNIPDPGDPTQSTPTGVATNWFINPGRLTLVDSANPPTVTQIPLHSGEATTADPITAVNLNSASPTTGKYAITGTNDPMWVAWVNVLQNASAPTAKTNQIVGRYAFWIDDENAKINFNTARGKPASMAAATALPANWNSPGGRDLHSVLTPTFNVGSTTFALGHPASVNLDSLGVNVATLDTDVTANGFFTQPDAIKNYATGDPDAFYEQNKFQLTPFSRAPEFNVFGKSRIFTGAVASDLAAGPLYQHAGHPEQPLLFTGYHAGVGSNTASDQDLMRQMREPVVSALAHYLQRKDWPGMGTREFRWKSLPNGYEEADQIALNIASMGYWATTPADDVGTRSIANAIYRWAGVTGAYPTVTPGPDTTFWKGPLSGRPMLPPFPGPQITEIGCTVIPELIGTGPNWRLTFQFALELYQPPGNFSELASGLGNGYYNAVGASNSYGLRDFLTNLSITVTTATSSRVNTAVYSNPTAFLRDVPELVPRDGYVVQPVPAAPYYVSTGSLPVASSASSTSKASFSGPATVTVKARFGTATKSLARLTQIVPVYVPDASAPGEMRPPSGNPDDAYLDFTFTIPAAPDYVQGYSKSREVSDPRILGAKVNWPLVATDSLGFENATADSASSGATQWAMWNFNPGNFNLSASPSPNYRANSIGMFSLVPTGMQRSIPYDSLRFYNRPDVPGELPDWVVLDLLAPTFPNPISLRNSTAGKINLNSKIYPDNPLFAPPARTAPLDALFRYMPHGLQASAAIKSYQDNGGYFDYIGKVCDVPGVADSTLGTTEYEMETLIRHLASLITTQSNTFTVWGVAQAVKKAPGNINYGVFEKGDFVTSERRFRAVVERYVWPGKEGVPGNARTDGGIYIKTATFSGTVPSKPGVPPVTPYTGKTWAEIDGPQQPQPPAPMATVPYAASTLENANNPLAAAMKYRVIFWEYID